MIVAGKCPPEPDRLEAAEQRGFKHVELYLEKKHLNSLEDSIRNVQESGVEAVSIHTPHVHLENRGYFILADQMARELDAYLVFHSQYFHHTHIGQLEKLNIRSEYGYENNPGASETYIQKAIIDKGYELVLDTAHFFLGDHSPEDLGNFLDKNLESIKLIHLCDSSWTQDGLAFGEGEMDMKTVSKTIAESGFDGILVLEVMPEDQEAARQKWERYTSLS